LKAGEIKILEGEENCSIFEVARIREPNMDNGEIILYQSPDRQFVFDFTKVVDFFEDVDPVG